MRGLPYYFMTLAVVSILIGMGWGIQMSVTMDHSMHPAHAHLNLIGWVGFAIFAFYYHLVPAAADTVIAKVHFALAVVGLVLIVPGIVMALNQTGETLAKLGSVLTVLSLLCFGIVVVQGGSTSSA